MILFLTLLGVVSIVSTMHSPPASWQPNYETAGIMNSGGQEASPLWFNEKLYLMQSVMGEMPADRSQGVHSYFCVYDAVSGEMVACPQSSSGWAFFSSIVDRTEKPDRVWVFGSAWDRANHTGNGQNSSMVCNGTAPGNWGCGSCALARSGRPDVSCSVGAWSSEDLVHWDGPFPAVTLAGNITVPNVAVAMIPPAARQSAAQQTGLPAHQAFMVLESKMALAINVGTDRDLSKNWKLLPMGPPVGYTSFGKACPTTRYDPQGNYYYVFGGGDIITLTRSKDLKLWEHATDMLATGCISDAVCSQYRPQCAANATSFNKCCVERPDCSLPQNGGRIAHGYFINYWANRSDCNSQGCVRDCVRNESTWNWSVNDADFTDEGGKGEHRLHRFVKCCCGCARSGDMQDISDDIDSSGGIGCDTLSCCSG
eukprot:m.453638 g.453638  ORF g.453638 m.453638 type:complete len:426 (-) comp21553_c0_seq1:403-1680(-)